MISTNQDTEVFSIGDRDTDTKDQTQPIAVKDGFVTFTVRFKYLGSFISYNLRDDFDIDLRIKKAGQAMGALKHFFNNEHIDTYSYSTVKVAPAQMDGQGSRGEQPGKLRAKREAKAIMQLAGRDKFQRCNLHVIG